MAIGTEVGSGFVSIIPSARGFGSALDRGIGPSVSRSGRKQGSEFGSTFVKSSLGPLRALGLLGAGLFVGVKTFDVFKGFVADARESAKVGALTNQVLKSTKGIAGQTTKSISKLATAISRKTGIDDEAVQTDENLLLTFTNIRDELGKGNKIFTRATGLVEDMSVALGQDGASSAIQLGKALNDPIKGVTALQRVGVSFTAQQKAQIKTLVDSGKVLTAQKIILREIGREFGGAAAAAATPMQRLSVTLGNLRESIGGGLIPLIDRGATALDKFTIGFQDGTGAGGRFRAMLTTAFNYVKTNVLPNIRRFFGFVRDDLNPALVNLARTVLPQLVASLKSIVGSLKEITDSFNTGKGSADSYGTSLVTLVNSAGPVLVAELKLIALNVQILTKAFLVFTFVPRQIAQIVVPAIKALSGTFLTTVGVIVNGAAKAFGWIPGLGGRLRSAANDFNIFKARVTAALSGFRAAGFKLGSDFAAGLAAGISAGGTVAVATAQGVANKVTAEMRSARGWDTGSPSKVATKIGGWFSLGLAKGIGDTGQTVVKSARDVAQAAVDALTSRLDTLRSRIGDLRSTLTELKTSVRDAVTGTLDVGSLRGGLGAMFDIHNLASRAGQFVAALKKLADRHVAPGLIEAIAQAGPDQGLAAAQSLGNLSKSQIKSTNADFNRLGVFANQAAQITGQVSGLPEQIAELKEIKEGVRALVRKREHDLNVTVQLEDDSAPKRVRRKKLSTAGAF